MRFASAMVSGFLFSVLLAGCAEFGSPKGDPLPVGASVPPGYGVVLVAVTGPSAVDYIQYCRGNGGCLNFRFPPLANDIIALPVPYPSTDLDLNSITIAGRSAGVAPTGGGGYTEYGFIGVRAKPVFSVTQASVRFAVTLDTTKPGRYSSKVDPAVIRRAADKYGSAITSLPAENFVWPK